MLQIVWRDMCRFIQPYVIITIEMRHRNKLVSQFYIKLRNQNTDSSSVEFIENYQFSTSKISLFLFRNLCNLKDVIFFTFWKYCLFLFWTGSIMHGVIATQFSSALLTWELQKIRCCKGFLQYNTVFYRHNLNCIVCFGMAFYLAL